MGRRSETVDMRNDVTRRYRKFIGSRISPSRSSLLLSSPTPTSPKSTKMSLANAQFPIDMSKLQKWVDAASICSCRLPR